MDWNGNLKPSFVSRPETSFNFLYNYNYDHYPGLEMKYPLVAHASSQAVVVTGLEKNSNGNYHHHHQHHHEEKKKRLTSEQLESLESSFQKEIKLDADRKVTLARELGLQPRQVAVWFQNRRARWKAKQLERLYDSLKQEFDVVSMEKQKLQQEVLALKSLLKEEQPTKNQVSTAITEISGEETAESASVGNRSFGRASHKQIAVEGNYVLNVDDYNPVMPPYWGTVLPTSYP